MRTCAIKQMKSIYHAHNIQTQFAELICEMHPGASLFILTQINPSTLCVQNTFFLKVVLGHDPPHDRGSE